MPNPAPLRLHVAPAVLPPPAPPPDDRGPLLCTEELRAIVFRNLVSAWWIRRHVPGKRKLGRKAAWYQREVEAWIDTLAEWPQEAP